MKLYVLPVESQCNAHCPYCITRFRHFKDARLDKAALIEVLKNNKYEKIEITGGGEPSLHAGINDFVEICGESSFVQIYTNGSLDPRIVPKNMLICLSRAHHLDTENENIMGIKYDYKKYLGHKLKLSLMLHQSGISSEHQIKEYLNWAKDFADAVVIRQLFEYEDDGYTEYYKKEYVSTFDIFTDGSFCARRLENGNRGFNYMGLTVEIEERACACENTDPVLHASGEVKAGWGEV